MRARDPVPPTTSVGAGPVRWGGIPAIQRKAAIRSPLDPSEREADDVAERVMRMSSVAPIGSAGAAISRKCATCEEEEPVLQRASAHSTAIDPALDAGAAIRAVEREGEPLPRSLREFFEP
ncbi:MAG TPA: hypothetical protein VKE69_07220, partial [Planctomycetota bacterium]|nr:hypothetical protein [Planctomycetota bacterium]